ncbi:hypothetical protein LXL04_030650 [Taraxacum kok-saghyz]
MIEPLPSVSSLSPSVLSFLDTELHTPDDLLQASKLVSNLQNDCHLLDQNLTDLHQNLGSFLFAYSTHSDQVSHLFNNINTKLTSFQSSTSEKKEKSETFLGKELPALAREVARVEAVRVYAETALKLDTIVGDIEDAVSSSVNKTFRKQTSDHNSEEARFIAIKSIKLAEEVLTKVTKTRPQWSRLISAVDHRVDRALAILRPQSIADYRSLLTSLNWPPPLSTSHPQKSHNSTNPLLTMKPDIKTQYFDSFLALCKLQQLQTIRKTRQLQGHNRNFTEFDFPYNHDPLWAIEELVNPISISSQRHFSKWGEKPELIFALIYKITRDYVDSMEELLQPLVDKANLSGYSCREEWISAMVTSLSTYISKEIFPNYINGNENENENEKENKKTSWLNFIDLMISFDKKIKELVEQSGIMNVKNVSCLSVFCDRPDWLDLWSEVELSDAIEKLTSVLEDDKKWSTDVHESVNVLGYKSPAISTAFLRCLLSIIERCRSLPSVTSRARFLTSTCVPVIHKFLDFLLQKCQEAEGLTALTDDDALIKVTKCINGSRYFETVLKERSEELFFLEIGPDNGVFDNEISKLENFRTEWVEKLSKVIFRGFDSHSRDYIKSKKQYTDNKPEEGFIVSKPLIPALDYLQAKMSTLETNLNKFDFVGVWRQLASSIDLFLFSGLFTGYVRFSDVGVERLSSDLTVLFGVYKSWCLRPEGFFGKLSEGLKVLKMEERVLRGMVESGERWLKVNGIRSLSVSEVERVVKSRVYGN